MNQEVDSNAIQDLSSTVELTVSPPPSDDNKIVANETQVEVEAKQSSNDDSQDQMLSLYRRSAKNEIVKVGGSDSVAEALAGIAAQNMKVMCLCLRQAGDQFDRQLSEFTTKITKPIIQLHAGLDVVKEDVAQLQTQISVLEGKLNHQLNQIQDAQQVQPIVVEAGPPELNVTYRQFLSLCLLGPDTLVKLRTAPLFYFDYLGQPPYTFDKHVTIFPRTMFFLMLFYAKRFVEPLHQGMIVMRHCNLSLTPFVLGYANILKQQLTSQLRCLTNQSAATLRRWALLAPATLPKTTPPAVAFVCYTNDFIRELKKQRERIRSGRPDMKDLNVEDLKIDSTLCPTKGELTIHSGADVKADRRKGMPTFIPYSMEEIRKQMETYFRGDLTGQALLDFVSERRYWNIPASREYLEKPANHAGFEAIMQQVFEMDVPLIGTFHIGPLWQPIMHKSIYPFNELMAKMLKIQDEVDKSGIVTKSGSEKYAQYIITRQQPSRKATSKRARSPSPIKSKSKKDKKKPKNKKPVISSPHSTTGGKKPKSLMDLNHKLAAAKQLDSASEDEVEASAFDMDDDDVESSLPVVSGKGKGGKGLFPPSKPQKSKKKADDMDDED